MATATPVKGKKKSKDEAKPKLVDVNVIAILDMSGSMSVRAGDTIGGFNSFIADAKKDQKEAGGKVTATLVVFDAPVQQMELTRVFDRVPIQDVKPIGPEQYTPRGNTPLYDAIGETIGELVFPEGEKVLVYITTDGLENASRRWRGANIYGRDGVTVLQQGVKELIEAKEAQGWEFMLIGAGMDAFSASAAFTTPAMTASTVSTPNTDTAFFGSYAAIGSQVLHQYRRGAHASHTVAKMRGSHDYDAMIDRSQPGMAVDDLGNAQNAMQSLGKKTKAPKAKK